MTTCNLKERVLTILSTFGFIVYLYVLFVYVGFSPCHPSTSISLPTMHS